MRLIPAIRPDHTLLWLPDGMAARLKVARMTDLTPDQWSDAELQGLLASRLAANEAKQPCTAEWHVKNGYA